MSTDDSISEDVSSSGALSHGRVSADGGKESEASLASSEGTSASGPAVPEERRRTSQTKGGAVESRSVALTPACTKIRRLCLSTDEAFEQTKSLPFINPSSLETLRALVQEIQSSGETDPEVWKDCESRWLHLFQLVEKQYQEQILAQQEQYQCQIQLIQDEIKALLQLQNRQTGILAHADFSAPPPAKSPADTKDAYVFPLVHSDPVGPAQSHRLAAPVQSPFSSPSPPLPKAESNNQGEEPTTTVLSSGYGTLTAWEASLGSPKGGLEGTEYLRWSSDIQERSETPATTFQLQFSGGKADGVNDPAENQQKTTEDGQQFTSWAQRQKLRPRKSKSEQASPETPEDPGPAHSVSKPSTQTCQEVRDQLPAVRPPSSSLPLMRSDSLMSETSGFTYWRLNECELYRPLPDSFDSGAYVLLQEASKSLNPPQEPRLSLREIYHNKRRDWRRSDGEGSGTSRSLSPQVPTGNPRQSDHTSGFTSPSFFSSPSFAAQPHLYPRVETPVTPDSMAEYNPDPPDCASEASRPSPTDSQQHTASPPVGAEEDGRRTGALKPGPTRSSALRPAASRHMEPPSPGEDPIVLSLLRQNLREKHSRHVADLKAYYESEIQSLREKLQLRDLPQDLEKSNQALTDRCKHLEEALVNATRHIQDLEETNLSLEKKLADWAERYAVAAATVKSLQQRLEEGKRSGREKDALTSRLKTRVQQLEEAAQAARRDADEKQARREREYKMLQDLLSEYDCLTKEHESVKNNLVSAERKLVDSSDHISELKRVVSKLEAQVKQLEHENQARVRHAHAQPSGAGLFHHPDLLLSPSKSTAGWDVPRRKSDQLNGARKPQLPQNKQPGLQRRSASSGSSTDASSADGSWRGASPPECEQSLPRSAAPEWSGARRDGSSPLTPMMKALIELEETKATQSRAPWVGRHRTTVGFVERKHKELLPERAELLQEILPPAERGGPRGAALLRARGRLSPDSHRSSSLPPPAQRNGAPSTPTKRETLLKPLSAKSSPKRCPSENYSTAFGHPMPREEHLQQRSDGETHGRRHSFHSGSPRKRLQFPLADKDEPQEPAFCSSMKPSEGDSQPGWEQQRGCVGPDPQDPCEDSVLLNPGRPESLAEAERLFDELTQEKLQIEAALSRIPGAGGRVSLQTRLDEAALENRLERLNRDLGSIRMFLKRFHILRSSANI
ncbi:M-phase phosphoprotein 9 [Oryzias latipes]|uniref:M-phase phosphoprotein 9 n=1 Tax=Oryzias latipes TaxID=8090 RepID=A0A3B3HFX7_ORYLA|nr:M-phase phosphoprotein 9 [Oryzias latipes]XP_011479740.1 M-phase phosphoprotein 9 [Oryzias latipes]